MTSNELKILDQSEPRIWGQALFSWYQMNALDNLKKVCSTWFFFQIYLKNNFSDSWFYKNWKGWYIHDQVVTSLSVGQNLSNFTKSQTALWTRMYELSLLHWNKIKTCICTFNTFNEGNVFSRNALPSYPSLITKQIILLFK